MTYKRISADCHLDLIWLPPDLFVSEDTVKTHARRMFRKLGARDRAHAVAEAFRSGLVC